MPPHGRRSIKLAILGGQGSGKTKLIECLLSNQFSEQAAGDDSQKIKLDKSIDARIVELEINECQLGD